ncbi:MAG: hypothetical protein ACFFB3_17915 [Candidatus Hodarchaeota archaeon]
MSLNKRQPTSEQLWDGIESVSGVLTDEDISLLGRNGLLISAGYADSQVNQSCYELRVGKVAYLLSNPESERKQTVDENHPLVIRPMEIATIITFEEIRLPDFIVGRIISKGRLFSIGLSPVITYADPGFSGNLGITFINLSKRRIRLNYLEPICKIEFEKLGKSVIHPYHGQHNFASQLWPIDTNKFLAKRNIEKDDMKGNKLLRADAEYFGEPFDLIAEKLLQIDSRFRTVRFTLIGVVTVLLGVLSYPVLSLLLSSWTGFPESLQSGVISGVVAGILTLIGVIVEWLLYRRRGKN